MKEKKSEPFFLFRKSSTRYSFMRDKKKGDLAPNTPQQQIQRLSWSSFPLLKLSNAEDKGCPKEGTLPSQRSLSSENLKKQGKGSNNKNNNNNNIRNKLSKSKSSSIFKSSSSGMKNAPTASSSSCPSTSSTSSSSSASSSPKVRQSWSSGVTHILERCGNECGNDFSMWNELHRNSNGSLGDFQPPPKPSPSDSYKNKYYLNCTKSGFPVVSLLEEDEEDEIMITPKIVGALKKTPDVARKTNKQMVQELERIKEIGMHPDHSEFKLIPSAEPEKENISPNYENYPHLDRDFDLNSLKGYKTPPVNRKVQNNYSVNTHNGSQRNISSVPDESEDKTPSSFIGNVGNDTSSYHNESIAESNSTSSECNDEYFGSNLNGGLLMINPIRNPETFSTPPTTLDCSSLTSNDVLIQDDSDAEDNELMGNDVDYEEECSSFEKRLEDDLEKLDERGGSREKENEAGALSDEEEKVQLRRKIKHPNLYIDVERARLGKTLSNERLLRRVVQSADGGSDSQRSSRSSPRTPRSPAIDIDDLFKQRQRQIDENPKDKLTQVKDLAERLRLPTKPPPHIDWLNGIRDKSEARHLAEAMTPVAMETPDGVFGLGDRSKVPTEEQRRKNISNALLWIKDELVKMKQEDQHLARQLVTLQLEMQRLRLHRSCTQHEALLEEVTFEEEDQKAFMTSTDLIDLPSYQRVCGFMSLRDFGVTRMNIANRRFTLR